MPQQFVGKTQAGSRTVVITGGNSGLGFGSASAILKSPNGAPWHVILGCRDNGRAQAAVKQLISGAGVMGGEVEAMPLDLASLASVRTFANELKKRLSSGVIPPLHAVVCNAGANPFSTKTVTVDGFESIRRQPPRSLSARQRTAARVVVAGSRGGCRQRSPRSGAEVRGACTGLE